MSFIAFCETKACNKREMPQTKHVQHLKKLAHLFLGEHIILISDALYMCFQLFKF